MISALDNTTAYPVATAVGGGSGSYTTKRPHSDIAHPFVFIIPTLCAIAFFNNFVIISVSIASKRFSKELFPSVRLLYGTLAILDISCVVTYQFIEWIGTQTSSILQLPYLNTRILTISRVICYT